MVVDNGPALIKQKSQSESRAILDNNVTPTSGDGSSDGPAALLGWTKSASIICTSFACPKPPVIDD